MHIKRREREKEEENNEGGKVPREGRNVKTLGVQCLDL